MIFKFQPSIFKPVSMWQNTAWVKILRGSFFRSRVNDLIENGERHSTAAEWTRTYVVEFNLFHPMGGKSLLFWRLGLQVSNKSLLQQHVASNQIYIGYVWQSSNVSALLYSIYRRGDDTRSVRSYFSIRSSTTGSPIWNWKTTFWQQNQN